MGRYVTEIEAAFIGRSLAGLNGPRAVALDAGAGSGRITALLSAAFQRVVATETRSELVRALAGVAPNVTPVLVEPAAEHLPIVDASADAVVSIQAADLAQAPWFHQECMRVLRPGGRLILNMQNRRSWKGVLAQARQARYRAEYGAIYYSWTMADVVRRLGDAGLEIEHAAGYNWLPFDRMADSGLVHLLAKLERMLALGRLPAISPWVLICARRP